MLSLLFLLLFLLLLKPTSQVIYLCNSNAACGCSTNPALIRKIVGGENATINTWGWAVSLLINQNRMCGGSILSSSWILTAAHCVDGMEPYQVVVSAATNQLFGWKQWRFASSVITHPQYDNRIIQNDIALIEVAPPFNMTDSDITKICLPMSTTEDYPPINSSLVVIGWGQLIENGSVSETLQQVALQRISYESYTCHFFVSNKLTQFCAGAPYDGKEQHLVHNITQTACQSCGHLPSLSHSTISPSHLSKTDNQKCQVCYDQKPSQYFRPISHHRCLQINRTICNECIYSHIRQSFETICTENVRCPELNCGIKYEYDTIKDILYSNNDIKLFERYDQFICRNQLEQMEEFIWCSNPKCATGQLNDGGESNNIVTCMRCSQKSCFVHKIPWHEGITCEEYDSNTDVNIRDNLKWITQNTKQCPKCNFRIEKNDGCDHMICIKCQYEFCWACLADFNQIRKDGNHQHDSNCKHYAAYNKS